MTPSPDQLRICAHLLEHPEESYEFSSGVENDGKLTWYEAPSNVDPWRFLQAGNLLRGVEPSDLHLERSDAKYSREGLTLLILHLHDCDQYGVIDAESPDHLWFSRHGGYYKLSKDTGEVETLKEAEF